MSLPSKIDLPKCRLSTHKLITPQIYKFLRKNITEGYIKPETRLSENLLSQHFNVSRQPVREAMMHLSFDGLLQILPQRGSIVTSISIENIVQTVFVRLAIEKECVLNFNNLDAKAQKHCLSQLEKVLIKQAKCINSDMIENEKRSLYLELDDLFHEKLCAISGGNMAWGCIQNIKAQIDRIRFLTFVKVSPLSKITDEHAEIFRLISEGKIDESIKVLEAHVTQILDTHKIIMQEYKEWFKDTDYEDAKLIKRNGDID